MNRFLLIIILCVVSSLVQAQHTFQGTSLSKALIELDRSSKHYDISFVYDELEDFTVTKTVKRGRNLPDAVREVCGFYPVRISVKGRDILVECIQKDRTKLMGHLIGPDRQPVAYANITLFPPSDSVYIGGGVSNEAGDFVIPCGAERARVRISCVGFKTIERVMAIGDAGTIRMQMENNYLGDVTVSGRMPVIRSQTDRLQYIVSNDRFAHELNAQELLSRVPMVSMAGGRAMILGKGPARFMLNGRVAEMGNETIQQKLWTLRSEDIERIEVISTPSGRDMIEMGGGYINIVMRRDQTLGWRGDVSAEAGYSSDWSERGSASVSYASKKFDMTIDTHCGHKTQTTDNLTNYRIHVWDKEYMMCASHTHTTQTDKEMTANLMLRLLPIKNLEIGAMLSWQSSWPEKTTKGEIDYLGQTYLSKPFFNHALWSEAKLKPDDNTQNKSLTAYYDWQLDRKGKKLSFTYNNFKKDDDAKTNVRYESPIAEDPMRWVLWKSTVDYHIQSGRLDLSLPFNDVTIDAGGSYTCINNKGHYSYTPEDYNFLHHYPNFNSNDFDYQEKTKAAYLSLHHEWGKCAFKAGLRYEHIDIDRELDSRYDEIISDYLINPLNLTGRVFARDYWLPSFSFSIKPKIGHQIGLSWATSTIRPNFYDLNPLCIYKTGFEYYEGNPNLKPSRTSNIELSYHNHQGVFASGYHHHISNMVENGTVLAVSDQIVVNSYPANLGKADRIGLYLRYQHQFCPSLLATAEGDVYYQYFESTNYYIRSLHGWGERLGLSADWYLNRQHTLMLNARYQHWFSDITGTTKTEGYGYFYVALHYSIQDDRLRFSLVANDPFHQFVTDETMNNVYSGVTGRSERTSQLSHTNHHAHYIGLTATYSFGGKKVRRIHHDTKDTERQRAEKII